MANEIKYVSLSNLEYYDDKIKQHIEDADNALKTNLEGQVEVVATALDNEITRAKAAEATNAAAAQAAQTDVDNLEIYVGTFTASEGVDTVVKYIDAKTSNIASDATVNALAGRVTQAETDIDNIEKDYLKAADKTELEGKITNVQTAVDTEKSRAEGIEGGLRTDVDAIKGDYLKGKDKEELQGNIDTVSNAVELLTNGVGTDEIDSVNELINYVKEHGTEVTGMQGDIAQNASDIASVGGRVDTLEGEMDAVEGAVATKAEKTYVDGELAKKVDKVDGYGLSKNDLSDALKANYDAAYAHSQVAHAPANAQENVIETVKVNGTAVTVENKAVNIVVPTDNAELANGAGYLVAADIANKADKGTTLASYGIADAYTSAQTDTAIANAIGQFEECTTAEIEALFA